MVNCRFNILVRGFRRVYKRRGLYPGELITGIENASKQSTEVLVDRPTAGWVCGVRSFISGWLQYIQDRTLMRCTIIIIAITKCPNEQNIIKIHVIRSNVK